MRNPKPQPPPCGGDAGALADLIRIFAGSALREFDKKLEEEGQAKGKAKREEPHPSVTSPSRLLRQIYEWNS
jgi:hypothetical protein